MSTNSLDKLPVELIYQICSYLREPLETQEASQVDAYSFDEEALITKVEPTPYTRREAKYGADLCTEIEAAQHALAALSSTCRRLYTVAQPMLFVCPTAANSQRLESLVAALEQQPDLAAGTTSANCSFAADNTLVERLIGAAPNLQKVRTCLYSEDDSLVQLVQSRAAETETSAGWQSALHVHRCSHVKWLPGHQHQRALPFRPLQPPQSPQLLQALEPFRRVTALHLWHTTMDAAAFRTLLGTVHPALDTVSIRLRPLSDDEGYDLFAANPYIRQLEALSLRDTAQALSQSPFAQTLRFFSYTMDGHHSSTLLARPMADCSALVGLNTLWLDAAAFPGLITGDPQMADILPPQLQTLRISGIGRFVDNMVSLADAVVDGNLARLAHFVFDEHGYAASSLGSILTDAAVEKLRSKRVTVTIFPMSEDDEEEVEEENVENVENEEAAAGEETVDDAPEGEVSLSSI